MSGMDMDVGYFIGKIYENILKKWVQHSPLNYTTQNLANFQPVYPKNKYQDSRIMPSRAVVLADWFYLLHMGKCLEYFCLDLFLIYLATLCGMQDTSSTIGSNLHPLHWKYEVCINSSGSPQEPFCLSVLGDLLLLVVKGHRQFSPEQRIIYPQMSIMSKLRTPVPSMGLQNGTNQAA